MKLAHMILLAAFAAGLFGIAAADEAVKANFSYLVFREDCIDTFFVQWDLFNLSCIKASVIKVLGYGIVSGAFVVKLPQIIKIVQNGNVDGLSAGSVYLELISNVLASVTSFWGGANFNAYGETIIVAVGTALIMVAMWHYRPPRALEAAVMGVVSAVSAALFLTSEAAVGEALGVDGATAAQIFIYAGYGLFWAARGAQIVEVARTHDVAVLSLITLLMQFAGTGGRVFTNLSEQPRVAAASAVSLALNGLLLVQFILYSRGAAAAAPAKAPKAAAKAAAKTASKPKAAAGSARKGHKAE